MHRAGTVLAAELGTKESTWWTESKGRREWEGESSAGLGHMDHDGFFLFLFVLFSMVGRSFEGLTSTKSRNHLSALSARPGLPRDISPAASAGP